MREREDIEGLPRYVWVRMPRGVVPSEPFCPRVRARESACVGWVGSSPGGRGGGGSCLRVVRWAIVAA